MLPEDYQQADHAVLAGWLADATLTTQLGLIFTWAGWKTSLDALDAALTEPNVPPVLAAAGGSYVIRHSRKVERYLSGAVRSRRVVLDLMIRVQPTASATSWTDLLSAANKIKNRIDAQATAVAIPIVDNPMVAIAPTRGWAQGRLLLNAWMGET